MRWRGSRQSDNVEDRRGERAPRGLRGGAGAGSLLPLVLRLSRTRGGIVILIIGAIAFWYMGGDLGTLTGAPGVLDDGSTVSAPAQDAAESEQADFVSVVLADTEDTWSAIFALSGQTYEPPRLVLFRQATRSACGLGEAAMGPFYCPGDQKVYLDLSFFDDLAERHTAPGDFAQAYVLAHEVGHHVQTLLGISARSAAARRGMSATAANAESVRQELQADCFAGIWAHHAQAARNVLESGDIDEALAAASAIGDDRLQHQARGYVTPDSFTHGSSTQRGRWFRRGFEQGTLTACDTFAASTL